jgi:hypothetical protein
MVVKVSKPEINVREKISELDKPSGTAGQAMLAAETPQEQFNLIGAGRRNMIINGDMRIAQRGTSATGVTSNGYYATDRMSFYEANSGTYTVRQDNNSGLAEFPHYHHVIATTADTSLGSTELVSGLFYKIEGNDLQHLGYGTSGAKHTTLSFWVRTNVPGDYTVSIYKTFGSARVVAPIYTVEHAGVWQYVTLVIPPDTNTGILNSNGDGLAFYFNLSSGSSYTVSEAPNWSSYTTGNWSGGHTAHWGKTTNDYWHITGVQFEVGKVATPFEHRSFGEELALCQRYYFSLNYPDGSKNTWLHPIATNSNGGWRRKTVHLPVSMRSIPTCSASFTHSGGTNGIDGSSWTGVNTIGLYVNNIATENDYAYAYDVTADAEL